MKILKYSLLALVVAIAASGIYLFATLDLDQYKTALETRVAQATGRELKIAGEFHVAVSLLPTLAVDGVRFSNAAWAGRQYMLTAGRLEAQLSLLPLLSGELRISRIELNDLDLALETDQTGKGNWNFDSGRKPAGPADAVADRGLPELLARLSVYEMVVNNARLSFKDGQTGKVSSAHFPEITARARSFREPTEVTFKGNYKDLDASAEATVGPVLDLVANKSIPVKLDGTLGKATLKLSGKVGEPLTGKGIDVAIEANLPSMKELEVLADTKLPAVGPVSMAANVTATDSTAIHLQGLKLSAGPVELAGELDLKLGGARPFVAGRLASPLLDLTPILGGDQPQKKGERVFSKEKLPVQSLKTLDADLMLTVARLKNGDTLLEDVKLPVKINNGHLTSAPVKARMAGGDIALRLDLDANPKIPGVTTDISVKQMELGQLPKLKKKAVVTGARTDIALKLTGQGSSIAEFMAGSNGTLLVQVGSGTFPNSRIDLAGADVLMEVFTSLNPLAHKEPTSKLECAVVNFSIKDGMATTDKGIAIQTSKMNVVGSGVVNLKTEAVDIGLRPHAREGIGINLGNFSSAARLGGTLADTHPVIDAVGALRAGASTGVAVATFGLSALAEGIFDKSTSDPDPCATALGVKPSPSGKSASAPPAGKTPAKEKANPIKGAADAVKDTLGNLFGH